MKQNLNPIFKVDIEKLNKFAPSGVHFSPKIYENGDILHPGKGVGRGDYKDKEMAAIFVHIDELQDLTNRDFNANDGFFTSISIKELNEMTGKIILDFKKESIKLNQLLEKNKDLQFGKVQNIDSIISDFKEIHNIAIAHDEVLKKADHDIHQTREMSNHRNYLYNKYNLLDIVKKAYMDFLLSKENILAQSKENLKSVGISGTSESGVVMADSLSSIKDSMKKSNYSPIFISKKTDQKYKDAETKVRDKATFTAEQNKELIKIFIDKNYE